MNGLQAVSRGQQDGRRQTTTNQSKHITDLIQNSAGTFVAQTVCLRVEVLFDESRREG
jgi:hypothetical protein